MEPSGYRYMFKMIIIGNSGCGKSCLLRQATEKTFNNNHNMTIGVEFGTKMMTIDEVDCKCQIWDTAGQESFRSITRSYYRGSVGALVVFDLTSRESFEDSKTWYSDVKELAKTDVSIILIGNKSDLTAHREVDSEDAKKFAEENGLEYMETSAKTADNVDAAFYSVAKSVLQKIKDGRIDPATLGGAGSRDRSGSKKGGGGGANGNNGNSGGSSGSSDSKTVNVADKSGNEKKDKKCCE